MALQRGDGLRGAAEAAEGWWLARRERALRWLVGALLAVAVPWLGYQFWRLTLGGSPFWPGSPPGAVDLALRWREVRAWFAGEPVYTEWRIAVYPPASYALLWPWLGWLPLSAARWLWAAASAAALAWLGRLAVQLGAEQGAARGPGERALLALLAAAMYASGAAIGNGQVTLGVLAALLGALRLLQNGASWRHDLAAALLLAASLVKPTLTVPLLCAVLAVARRLRPLALTAALYVGLTLLAASFQPEGLITLGQQWLSRGTAVATERGLNNLHGLLGRLGLEGWLLPASLATLLALLGWCWWRREADAWRLAGVAAIVARLWAYHRWYDDLLLWLPLVALWRLSAAAQDVRWRVAAGGLFGLTLLSTLAPGGHCLLGGALRSAYLGAQPVIWLADLALLAAAARAERRPDSAQGVGPLEAGARQAGGRAVGDGARLH